MLHACQPLKLQLGSVSNDSHPCLCLACFSVPQFYQWAFAATATTIPAGAVAERFNFNAYLSYTVLVSAFVYPVIVHWVWDDNGWLGAARVDGDLLFGSGMIDFAGCGVVHMVGGLTGLMGAWLVGPRLGRFDSNGNPVDMPGHSATLVVLGTVLLWFGWYGFNPGSTLYINTTTAARVASRCAVTTTLSGCGGGLSCLFNGFRRTKQWDLCALCNGALVGFVCITAGCHVLEPWAAILAGFTGGLIFDGACWVWLKLRIDDPLSASPMHGVCGAWGLIMVGFLAKEEYVMESYSANRRPYYGCFYPGGKGHLLAAQVRAAGWLCMCACWHLHAMHARCGCWVHVQLCTRLHASMQLLGRPASACLRTCTRTPSCSLACIPMHGFQH